MGIIYAPPSLTAAQQRAVSTPGPLIVSASAGSGKTRVLVERYLRLLLEGCDIRRIVAMTFTRKAAAEMLDRTAGRLDRLFDAAVEPEELLLLRTLRERLISAQVSTFHSYCSGLLRRFPIEAGVPPTFGELSRADVAALTQDAIRAVVEQWITGNRRSDLAELISVFGSYGLLERSLEDLLASPQRLDVIRSTADEGAFWNCVSDVIRAIVAEQLALWRELWHRASTASLPPRAKRPPAETEEVLARVEHCYRGVVMHLGELDAPWQSALQEALTLFQSASAQRALRSPWKHVATAAESRQATRRASVIAAAIEASSEREQRAWKAQCLLLNLAREALEQIDAEKTLLAAFAPDDLQRRALALLNVESVRERLRWEIEHVLVDEFQDTDPIQYDVLHRLIPLPDVLGDMPELFIVGDPKQSIYGFRGADVRVFERARRDVVAAAGQGADVHLQTSFRMTPALVAVVNTVMRSVMPSQTAGYAVGYEELCTARPSDTCPDSHVALLIGMPEGTTEAELVASHIAQITGQDTTLRVWDEKQPVENSTGGSFRFPQYRDIVLLARKSSTFEPYVRALRAAGIPFRIESGRGFYQTQEVLDVLAFLRVVHNRHDDIALATVLRSPFIGLSDSELALIAASPPRHGSLADRLEAFVAREPSERIRAAAHLLDELLPIAIRMPPTALIRLLLRRTPWYARVQSSPRALQIEANVEKLLDAARQFERRGFRNLLDFVEELEQLRLVADAESEAAVVSDDNVVTLMTIHAAKGLEFPIVYLVGADQQTRPHHQRVVITDQLGVAIATIGDDESTALGTIARYLATEREDAEETRLLYVALTRAKDHLFIAGTLSKNRSSGELAEPAGYLGAISAALGITWHQQAGSRAATLSDYVRSDPDDEGNAVELSIEIIYTLPPTRAEERQISAPPRPLLIEPVASTLAGEIVSATQLMLLEKSPQEFYRVYRCGLPSREDAFRRALARIEEEDDVVGTLAGRIIHRTLEFLLPGQRHDTATIQAALDRALNEFRSSGMEAMRQRVERDVRATLEYLEAHHLLPMGGQMFVEQPIIMPIGEDFLLGVPDVLLLTPKGCEIWDWKTNRRDQRTATEWLEYYRTQLDTYLVLAAAAFADCAEFTIRLVMTRPPIEVAQRTLGRADIEPIRRRISALIERIKQTSVGVGKTP